MYFQRHDERYVSDPFGESERSSYNSDNGRIELYIKNKKHLSSELKTFFGRRATATLEKKVGDYNLYSVEIVDPILVHDPRCYITDTPDVFNSKIFRLTVSPEELANRKKRSEILKFFVLGPAMQASNFQKIVDEKFDKIPADNGLITLVRK